MVVEIDEGSGFCFGVTRAIGKAEEVLSSGDKELYCLGDIVHNGRECKRLEHLGLRTIGHKDMQVQHGTTVLLRAHGEPPSTYELARKNDISIIDATCPVVLHLQGRIKKEYEDSKRLGRDRQIVIFGKNGHAEVLGLVGQTEGTAIVIESPEEVTKLDFTKDICLYSQTTMSLDGFRKIVNYIEGHIQSGAEFHYADTICRQVANRMSNIKDFASRHDVILFVCGMKSSNGRVLFGQCQSVNHHSYMIETASEIDPHWLQNFNSVGICGATSTPKWLMEQCKVRVEELLGSDK